MNRHKGPTEKTERKRSKPSSKSRPRNNDAELERTIPGRRTPSFEKQRDRVVNEDEQLKAVNNSEDNAQTRSETSTDEERSADRPQDNENERLEAGNDNNEVHPRPPKVN